MSRTIKIIFTVSLALNVIFAGLAAGYAYKMERFRPTPPVQNVKDLNLSPEGQLYLKEAMEVLQNDMKESFKSMRAARNEMRLILEADEFDQQAYDSAATALYGLQDRLMKDRTERTRAIAVHLSAEDRQAVAPLLTSPFPFRTFKGHRCHARSYSAPDDATTAAGAAGGAVPTVIPEGDATPALPGDR